MLDHESKKTVKDSQKTVKESQKTVEESQMFFTVQQNHILVPVHDPLDLRRCAFLYVCRGNSPSWLKNNINIY